MKKLFLTSAIILAAGAANAATPYISLKAGYALDNLKVFTGSKDDDGLNGNYNGFGAAVAGGVSFEIDAATAIRAELEYGFTNTFKSETIEGETIDLDIPKHHFMANAYVDFSDESWTVKPYVGAGLGMTYGQLNADLHGDDDINGKIADIHEGFAYAFMIGANYDVTENWAIDMGAKYAIMANKGQAEGPEKKDVDTKGLSIMLGARYSF